MVELAAVGRESRPGVEDPAEDLLDFGDVFADAGTTAELCLQVRGGRKVVRVGVRFEDPVHRGAELTHASDQAVGLRGASSSGFGVIVEHAVDNYAAIACGVANEVAESACARVEKSLCLHADTPDRTSPRRPKRLVN